MSAEIKYFFHTYESKSGYSIYFDCGYLCKSVYLNKSMRWLHSSVRKVIYLILFPDQINLIKTIVKFDTQLKVGEIIILKNTQFYQTHNLLYIPYFIPWLNRFWKYNLKKQFQIRKIELRLINFDVSLIHFDQLQPHKSTYRKV